MNYLLKCKRCRHVLVNQQNTTFLDSHNIVKSALSNSITYDCRNNITDVWYLQENEIPQWIVNSLNNVSVILK